MHEILAEWTHAAREQLEPARQLSSPALVDHVPALLEEIGDLAEHLIVHPDDHAACETARQHAIARLEAGFAISTIVAELSALRACILRVWVRENADGDPAELSALNLAIDSAIETSVERYAEARDRTLAGIDRISMASLEARDLDELLEKMLAVFVDSTPSVDTAAILLRDGDAMRVRAAVGFEREPELLFAIGEGFVGSVAATLRASEIQDAASDPRVQSPALRASGIRALYGVPLVRGNELFGVAHMGSRSANAFAPEDCRFFSSVASRATLGIYNHTLRRALADTAADRERALGTLEALLAAAPIGLGFVDRDLRYLRVNDALAALNGKPAAEHVGRTVREVLPQHAEALEAHLRSVLESGKSLTNVPATLPTGERLLFTYFPVRDPHGDVTGVGGIVVDVTEEHRAHEALRLEQTRLQSILEHTPAAIWIKDAEGRIVLANHRLAEALGHALENVIGKRSDELLPSDVANQHQEHDRIVLRDQRAIEVEETVPSPEGTRTFLSIKFPIPSEPPLVGGIAAEITERKRMEDALRAAVQSRDDILAVVSHDLRNPLGTIALSVSMLQGQDGGDPRLRRHFELIQRASTRMEKLIQDLLDMANIRTGRLHITKRDEAVDHLVAEAVELQHPLADEHGIELVRRCDLPGVTVCCDHDRILQVFGNLIGNAVKACQAGDRITVAAERRGDRVQFSVADTGPGIDPEALPHIFDAYWSGAAKHKGSSGLGLYISRGIVDSHGGTIAVDSVPGAGATFSFTLPITR